MRISRLWGLVQLHRQYAPDRCDPGQKKSFHPFHLLPLPFDFTLIAHRRLCDATLQCSGVCLGSHYHIDAEWPFQHCGRCNNDGLSAADITLVYVSRYLPGLLCSTKGGPDVGFVELLELNNIPVLAQRLSCTSFPPIPPSGLDLARYGCVIPDKEPGLPASSAAPSTLAAMNATA